jgi:hypothetical protein
MTHASANDPIDVYFELGQKRVFACALAWPGWCRSGKTEDDALAALAAYAPRYAVVAGQAGVAFPQDVQASDFHVVERVTGSAGYTDFGAPGAVAERDRESWTAAEAARQVTLLRACWEVFDRVAAAAPAELRKGPRGGGRDRDRLIEHVLRAESAYARKLGVKQRQPAIDDAAAIAALREAISAALLAARDGLPSGATGWPARYAARRLAWHVLDHAWEMEDRSAPAL